MKVDDRLAFLRGAFPKQLPTSAAVTRAPAAGLDAQRRFFKQAGQT